MPAEIVPYEPGLLAAVAALQTRLWSPDTELNARYFRWKHEQNPYFDRPRVFLAVDAGKAVAMRGFYGSCWETGASENRAADHHAASTVLPIASDAVTVPGHENTGLMRALMAHALSSLADEGWPCVLNFTASPVTLMSSLAAGWKATAPLEQVARKPRHPPINRVRRRLETTPFLWRVAASGTFDMRQERQAFRELDARGAERLRTLGGPLSLGTEPRAVDMAELIGRIGHDGRLRQRRDARWLSWRYANPLAAYRFIYYGGDRLEGFVVLEQALSRNAERLRITLVDCEAATPEALTALLNAVSVCVTHLPVLAWRKALPPDLPAALSSAGFEPQAMSGNLARQRPCLLLKPLARQGNEWQLAGRDLRELQSWDLRRVYGD